MTDEQMALLRNIRSNPHDDLSRLVYADWVEERGDQPMAELIRCHIERERLDPQSPQHFDLVMHTSMLLAQHRDRWTGELNRRFGVTGVEFVRGIPEEVEIPIGHFAGVADDLFATLPIRHVMLSGVGSLAEVRRLTLPANVLRSVALPGCDPDQQWQRREGWPVPQLSRLFTVLDPAPPNLEQCLRVGRWQILCPAAWSGPDRETERSFFDQFCSDPDYATEWGQLRLTTRLFNAPAEFERWCPVPNPASGPHWLMLENGQLVSHQRSLDLPAREDEDHEVYDGDLE